MFNEVEEYLGSMNPKLTDCIGDFNNSNPLKALSDLLEEELSEDLVEFYSKFSGNENTALVNFAYGVCFHSMQRCLSSAQSQAETDVDGFTPDYPLEYATPEIDSRYTFNRSRVEIGHDWGTYLVCTDYAPTKHGTFGQIIMLDYENSKAFVVASSIAELMDQFSKDLKADRYSLTKHQDNEYWLEPEPEIDLGNWYISPSRWPHVPR